MKARPGILLWKIAAVLVIVGVIGAVFLSRPDKNAQKAAQKAVEETRQALRQQGFKTDLADFDFSTSAEVRAREAILLAATTSRSVNSFQDYPDLMTPVGTDSAIVFWKQDAPQTRSGENLWPLLHDALNEDRQPLDAACAAIMSGPIIFNLDARRGDSMLLPHLATVKKLGQMFGSRAMLDLHDGNRNAAWTNLMAATRLVKVWEPEPTDISHLVRFADLGLMFNATWQALQTNGWPDDRLARLQTEWESVDLFTNLPMTAAFKRASNVAVSQRGGQEHLEPSPTLTDFFKEALRSPFFIWVELNERWNRANYLRHGSYEDQKDLLLFYRDRELELRTAVQAPTWAQMRQLPGVTNEVLFQSKYSSRMQVMMNLRRINMRFQRQGSSLLARAAEAEARRRILITAIALERYRGRHGSYPKTLAELAPEFLKTVPVDFMDGQPLRYQLTDDGHFILYSIGLDCVDNGGKMRRRMGDAGFQRSARPDAPLPEADIVWPLPAGDAAMQVEQQIQTKAKEREQKHYLNEISDREWKQSPSRQSRIAKILAMNWSVGPEEPTFKGQSIESLISNEKVSGTNQLSLGALLTPKQIVTGNEPEDITFELPISYDAITNKNSLFVVVDADPEEELKIDSGGKVYERERATNGDCLVVWHAIYDPPGRHAVQVYLILEDKREGTFIIFGPPIAVTTTNLCQFSLDSVNYDVDLGARFHARLPEKNGIYSIECLTTNGAHLATLNGSTSNGEFNVVWNLVDDHGHRLNGETFNSIVHITLPDSGRLQTLKGP